MLKAPFFFWHHPPGAHLVSACASPGQGCRAPEQPTWSDELTPRLAGLLLLLPSDSTPGEEGS